MRKARIAGTRRPASSRPRCSVGHTREPVRNPDGSWVCPDCFNEHVDKKRDRRSLGGVELPPGVKISTHDYFSDVFPNRRARRRALRG